MTYKTSRPAPDGQRPDNSRRRMLLRGGAVAGGLTAFAAGYGEVVAKGARGLVSGTSGVSTKSATRGNSLTPEFRIDPVTGQLTTQPGQVVSPSSCLGCWTQCGVRVRVDTEKGQIIRIAGNPYHPLSTTNSVPMAMPVREAYATLGGDSGIEGRATSCARGSAMLEHQSAPHRVLTPLKRVGPRGSGQWKSISLEQLVQEVCEGGDLFGEGHVDGLRAIRDVNTLIDPENPEYGPKSNQLVITDASNEGRTPLIRRFAGPSFGTVNFANHGAYCGQTYRVGTAAALGNIPGMPHGKPDWKNSRFGLFLGTAPAQAGNPFQRMGRELAEARSREDNSYKYVVISPMLPTSSSHAAGDNNRWLPVKPATDLALAMALIRWIIDNERYDAQYLSQPGPQAMAAAGEASWSNATHLLINDPKHPRFGQFLRGADIGLPMPEPVDEKTPAEDVYVVQLADGTLSAHTVAQPARLVVERTFTLPRAEGAAEDPTPVPVCTSFAKLREHAHRMTIQEYSDICGVSVQEIEDLAREFTSHGKRAVANSHGGTMSGAGFYTAYAIAMLNNLVGNLNVKGGWVLDAGPFGPFGPGPRYNFATFEGQVKPTGVSLSRTRFPYEKTSEFRRKKEAGENPYPARAPWYPAPGNMSSEMVAAGLLGYPYAIKAWINHMSNPVYAIAGFEHAVVPAIRDPKKLPLFISVDPFINETSALADYIVPDTVTYESWGIGAPWADVIAKTSTVRWPVVEPATARTADGRPVNLESFLFAVARQLQLPGFGKNAMSTRDGEPLNLENAEDFYVRGVCNIAYQAGKPVPEASDDDIEITGLKRWMPEVEKRLKPEEVRRVAMVLSRGGRFDTLEDAWVGEHIKAQHKFPVQLWHEGLARMHHSMTGERYVGCPTWFPTRFADGSAMREHYPESQWPLTLSSYKSNLMSSMSIAVKRLRQVHPHNPISLHKDDAARLGIANGDHIEVSTPGASVRGMALVRSGIAAGTVAIEYGYGHRQLGATAHTIDGKETPHDRQHGAGVNLNDLGFTDPTRPAKDNVWIDWVSGAVVRQGLPVRVRKV
ncbi:tetrathionate reductase subunit TtrA [Melaminivora suipulveris]|uniref:Tetrathionate reductase subunit TtrA n=1 Tax=Melaminivora suipulveris TaxID=2109913 RepID=A0A2R3QF78_9BURK|nr:tetrathionate reductase subunit A [Melaminivora suipulveris]AVO50419.1 tetrathionate reductase subunit TtrA [Melaminivora suipulveris]